tara:strand:+ start:487 stop:864 length:378 start_codon:yes stop_codon:yes gene_type:complete
MNDFVPKTAEITDTNQPHVTEENSEFIPIKRTGDNSKLPADATPTFQQKQAKPVDQSSLSPDALKGVEVPPADNAAAPGSAPAVKDSTETDQHEFKVQIIRDGDRITKMLVQCKCGETIPLDCIY